MKNRKNEDKEIELFYSCVNTQFRETQTLLYAKTKDIKNKIAENNLKMFWSVRILRRSSLKTMDKHKRFFFEKDNFSIVCEEDYKLETYKIHEYFSYGFLITIADIKGFQGFLEKFIMCFISTG